MGLLAEGWLGMALCPHLVSGVGIHAYSFVGQQGSPDKQGYPELPDLR